MPEKIKPFCRPYKKGYLVLAKCPFCQIGHLVPMTRPPVVQPRVYCPDHIHLRNSEGGDYIRKYDRKKKKWMIEK